MLGPRCRRAQRLGRSKQAGASGRESIAAFDRQAGEVLRGAYVSDDIVFREHKGAAVVGIRRSSLPPLSGAEISNMFG